MHLIELLPEYDTLTAKEEQLLRYVVQGYTNAEIAELHKTSYKTPTEKTVETWLSVVYDKLNVRNRTEVFVKLVALGNEKLQK
jgi:DNA-binding NarL/FixJ family response regulator